MTGPERPFWRAKRLTEMTPAEWESLCDGCGKCCLNKLEDWDTGEIVHTAVACRLPDLGTCRCGDYAQRRRIVPECVVLTPENVGELRWMPSTCAYRLLAEGRDLPVWHHLVCGDRDAVHRAGVSVLGWAISEDEVDALEDHLLDEEP